MSQAPYASMKSPRRPYTSETTGAVRKWLPKMTPPRVNLCEVHADKRLHGMNGVAWSHKAGREFFPGEDPTIRRGARDARHALKKVRSNLRIRSKHRMGGLPPIGPLADLLTVILGENGIDPKLVLNARFVPKGADWFPCITLQGGPQERNQHSFQEDHTRPSYCADLGMTFMPDGVHVSEITIRDAVGRTNFITGKKPRAYIVPFEGILSFVQQLPQRPHRPRTVTLDQSCRAALSKSQEAVASALGKLCQTPAALDAMVVRKVQSLGQEYRENRSAWKGTFTERSLDHLAAPSPVSCLQCEALITLRVNPTTLMPRLDRDVRCHCCGALRSVGDLLASRARDRGVQAWLVNSTAWRRPRPLTHQTL